MCWTRDASSRPAVDYVVRCLKEARKCWTADAATFLSGNDAGVREVMKMNRERAQELADELDKVR